MRIPPMLVCCALLLLLPVNVYAEQKASAYLEDAAKQLGGTVVDGKWLMVRSKSSERGVDSLILWVLADKKGGANDLARLGMGCIGDKTTAFFSFEETFSQDESAELEYRIDKQPIVKKEWETLGNSIVSFRAISFLKSLIGKKRLAIRTSPDGKKTIEKAFNIEGIEKVIPIIQKECGWQ